METLKIIKLYLYIKLYYLHYCSKVCGHPDNFVFSMKTHNFIHQINYNMNIKSSQDMDEVKNNDFYCKLM